MFHYVNNELYAEQVRVSDIAAQVGTPFYCYSTAHLEAQYLGFEQAMSSLPHKICYAMKANSNQAVLKTFAKLGAGVDVVSGGELKRALKAGIPASKIMFSGVGKKKAELKAALEAGIFCINVESEPELFALNEVAQSLNVKAPISFRINPDVDAKTHAKISTGRSENKFGIPLLSARAVYKTAAALSHITVTGVDMHIGSQIIDLTPFDDAFALLAEFVVQLQQDGHAIHHVDVGGGLGIPYEPNQQPPDLNAYAAIVKKHLGGLNVEVVFEPGRYMVGNAGILVTEVTYVKEGDGRSFVIVDAAMNDLIRPTLYEAYHEIKPVKDLNAPVRKVDIVGPVCETGDYLALNRDMPEVKAYDLLAVFSSGAYGAVQAGTYNTRALLPEVLVKGDKHSVVRERQDLDELIAQDKLPNWL